MANEAVSRFTQSHSFVAGILLISVGVAGIIGSVSGNLAAMLAALFDPTDLNVTKTAALGGNVPGVPGYQPPSGGTPNQPGTPSLPSAPPILPEPSVPSIPGIGELPVITA